MFLVTTIVLGILLTIVLFDYLLITYELERIKRERNRAIGRISRLKKLLKEGEDDKDLHNE